LASSFSVIFYTLTGFEKLFAYSYETKWNEWLPELWNELGTPPPSMELLPPTYEVQIEAPTSAAVPEVPLPTGNSMCL
jgi:hypothetical protein